LPIAVLIISLMISVFMSLTLIPLKQAHKIERANGAYNPATQTLSDRRGKSASFVGTNYNDRDIRNRVETIETAMIRTCRAVSTLAHANGCSDWNKASKIWNFVGASGGVGSLDSLANGTTQGVFSCSNMASFGRGLFQQSVPSNFVVGQGYYYDFTAMNDKNYDPCGYIDIVRF